MPSRGKVTVAILSWNGLEHLRVCLPAVLAQRDPGVPWEVVVLDNGSQDGTVGWLRAQAPAVRVVASPVNLGFCAAYNRLVAASDAAAIVLLNNDTLPEADWLSELVRGLAGSPTDVAAVSGRIVSWDGSRLDFGRGIQTFDGHAFQLDYRRPLASARLPGEGEELPFACGGNMIVRRDSFLAAGGFDERFFAYFEDVDLGWRLWSGGERVVAAPRAVVRHRSGASSELLGLYRRGFLFERNAFLTVFKNFEPGLWERMMPAVLWTLQARTQALLLGNNLGMATLGVDPYAPAGDETSSSAPLLTAREGLLPGLKRRVATYGVRETARRVVRKLAGRSRAARAQPPALTDERTMAQFRVLSWLQAHLDEMADERARVQARRRVSDHAILARFPLYIVPTYPGDVRLFAQPGFAALLPAQVPLVRAELGEIMELG